MALPARIKVGHGDRSALRIVLALLQNTNVIVITLTALALIRIRTAHALWFGVGSLVALVSGALPVKL